MVALMVVRLQIIVLTAEKLRLSTVLNAAEKDLDKSPEDENVSRGAHDSVEGLIHFVVGHSIEALDAFRN